MKTDALIDLLAQGAGPAPQHAVARRLLPAAAAGLLLSLALALALIGPVPAAVYATPAPWLKLAYTGALALAAAALAAALARPVAALPPLALARNSVWLVLLLMAGLGLAQWLATPPGQRLALLAGHSWRGCAAHVLLLSLPGLGAALWALRGLAPTRPRAAGAAAGLMAGALGALGYAFSCTEQAPAFVALWYTLGIAASSALGAWLGGRVLRW